MCIKSNGYKRETLKSIKRMNSVLKTRFSYVYCIEEIDLLNMIPSNKETTNKMRLEHLSQVFGLWNKGLKEDYYAHNKSLKKYNKIKPLFEEFLACFVYELNHLDIIKEYSTDFDYSINEDYYKIKFNEYDYQTKKQKIDDIESLISVLNSFKLELDKPSKAARNDEIVSTYIDSSYYGPMSLFKGYKRIEKKSEKYNTVSKSNPYNKTAKSSHLLRYNILLNDRKKYQHLRKKAYYNKQIKVEIKRLKIELDRLKRSDERYDYYFDYFIWRLMFDLEYIFLKRLGGLMKVSELINIYHREKNNTLGDEPIVVDVDRMTVVSTDKPSSGGTQKSNGRSSNMDIKEFDQIQRDFRFRKEQNKIQRESLEKRR